MFLHPRVRRLLLADVHVVSVISGYHTTFFYVLLCQHKYDWKYHKCTHICTRKGGRRTATGRVTYNNGDEVHDDLSRRACQRHVSRVCRRNPIFYLDVVKTIRQLIMSRTAWTLRRKDGIRQYKLNTGGRTRRIVIKTNANATKRYCLLSAKSRENKNKRMPPCKCISSQRYR